MKVGIANDHRGYELKEFLKKNLSDYEIVDYGAYSSDSVDYPDYGFLLGEKVAGGEVDFGIAICGSGIGISIACNKVKGIRCAKVSSLNDAYITRVDNNANIIAMSADTNYDDALLWVKTFLETEASKEERHILRVKKIKEYEDKHYEC